MARNGNAAIGAAPADELAVEIENDEGREWFRLERRRDPDREWVRTDNAVQLENMR